MDITNYKLILSKLNGLKMLKIQGVRRGHLKDKPSCVLANAFFHYLRKNEINVMTSAQIK